MDSSVPYFKPGATITGRASAAVNAGRFVRVSGAPVNGKVSVAHAAANGPAIGVTSRTKAAGEDVMFYADGVLDVEAGATITAGASIGSDATGRAVPWASGPVLGTAYDDGVVGSGCRIQVNL